jgi:hypothetical protein
VLRRPCAASTAALLANTWGRRLSAWKLLDMRSHPLQPVLEEVFRDDRDVAPADMTVVVHSAFGELCVWHRRRRKVRIDLSLHRSTLYRKQADDRETYLLFSEDISPVDQLTAFGIFRRSGDPYTTILLPQAIAKHGLLCPVRYIDS